MWARRVDDLNYLPKDLEILEQRLCRHGSTSIYTEDSLNQLFQSHLGAGGSRTRAILALVAGHELNVPSEIRYILATTVELLHQASLIHDDIQDNDALRRGQASVWTVAGESAAICLGDNLIAAAFEELAKLPSTFMHKLPRLINLSSAAISRMAAGQTLDCQWRADSQVNFNQYEQIVMHKSGPLLGLPIALVAEIYNTSDNCNHSVMAAASRIGVAYQLADDLSDRFEDQGMRLNGFWVLAEQSMSETEAEQTLRQEFEHQLTQARQHINELPDFCLQAFDVLITALLEKYPAFKAAA